MRESLIQEGITLLSENQDAQISLRELARRVGVTANATYRHFANKEALLAALAAEGFRRLGKGQSEAAGTSGPGPALLRAGRAYLRFAWHNPALFRLMFGSTLANRDDPELAEVARVSFRSLRLAVATAKGVEEQAPGVETATLRAWGLVHGLSHLMLDGQLSAISASPLDAAEQALMETVEGRL
ncbi:TetR family transcriptional regulator [Alloalcanivorax dieselolei B5]|uniref:TetR family transcriptional regulator n=1 Tax=Alcanivorax dieselolei (strain DSM 16502 / CGMCC 1.3690 / MCCC 1A00001 / B-5) TaxID=930169 RepID=K0CJM3_ALCDB|nr:TetR/AcrR family transcriptional regulator [Alloalcanivorax dieselolei]AFT72615.1 TetR family transcriptional regulator [Alloalcanivorax dieselolei B5]GGJ79149.1 putative TetR-family transcriptional regulator [Alloalcanivorax dieselolei]